MNLATLTLLSLATVAGQAPPSSPAADYDVLRTRNVLVPIEYVAGKRNAIQQVMLVVSSNRGEIGNPSKNGSCSKRCGRSSLSTTICERFC